ncbi:unnamed protein product [Brassica rapa subsp. trilocularis]
MAQIPSGGDGNKKPQEEPVLYASIGFPPSESPTLHRDNVSLTLRKIQEPLPFRLLSAVATIGTEMYVLGGSVGGNATSDVTLIDCRLRTSQSLPSMRRARRHAVAGAIDGKIYVIGGCRKKSYDWVEVLDVKTRSWRAVPGVLPHAHWEGQFVTCAVMDDKIFVLDPSATCLVFDPSVGALVEWDDGVEMRSLWQASSCVVDDMLYTVDPGCSLKHPIVVYDPKAEERRWRPVYGVDLKKDLPPFDSWYDSKMANHGGKLVVLVGSNPWPCFHHGRQDVWTWVFFMRAIGNMLVNFPSLLTNSLYKKIRQVVKRPEVVKIRQVHTIMVDNRVNY